MIHSTWLPVLLGLLGLCYGLQCPKQKISPGREVVCYTSVSDVDKLTEAVCKCTTLVQQGHNVRNLSISEFEDFRKSLKEVNPAIQFAISVDDPGQTLRTSGTVRQEITARLMGVLKEVDGIELNMTAGSKERLVHFVKGLKNEMVRKSYDTRIFMVLPTKPEGLAKQFDLKELSKYVDLFTIPTHYLVEDDEAYRTFHPSRLMGLFDMFNADSLIDLISGLGVPKRKILVSLPSNAYEFTLKDQDDNAPRAPTEDMQPVIIDQKQLCDLMNQGEWTVERDEDLTAPYAFKNKTWIAFEDKISVSIKGKYALIRDLPGLGVRDIENDTETKCGKPLTHEVNHSFMDFKRKTRAAVLDALEDDLHQTQLSYPTKVRSSDFRVVRVVDTEGHIRAVRENTQTEFVCSRQGYFVHPKSCNRFYRCVKFNQEVEDYSVFEFDCPAGLAFDETTEVCVWPGSLSQGSPCPGSSEIAPVARVRFECPSTPGYYADPQNPRWFFACIDLGGPHMMAYEFRCPFGLIFDEHKLICEWPWLVEGYSGSGYTRVEYAYGGSGTGTTAGTGGYYTGALPHGFTGSTSGYQGGYKGQDGSVYQSGSEYQGGSGYKGGSSQGTTGYQGGVYHGSSGAGSTGAGSTGTISGGSVYTGSAGVGYTGSGHAGNGYTVSVGGSQNSAHGQGSTGYSGNAGGYAGSTTGHEYSGGATGIYSGSVDTGRYGSTSGSAGTGYTGSGSNVWTGTGAGQASTGSGSGVYTGATGTAQVHTGTGGTGTGGIYSGATGTGYTGTTNSAGQGVSGTSYSGSTGTGYQGSGVHGASGTGYTGSSDTGYKGSGVHGGSGTSYTGSTDTGYKGSGTSYTGSTGTVYQGSGVHGASGTGYTGSTDTGYKGSGTSYTGSTGTVYQGSGVHGASGTGYTGSTDTGYKGSGVHGGSGTSYTGSTDTGYKGSGTSYTGSTGTVYQGSGVHGASGTGYTGSTDTGYKGSGIYGGSGTGYAGSTAGGYQKTTGGAQVGTGISYTGSTAGGYQGSSGGIHGDSGISYTGSTAGVYQGSTSGVHEGSGISYTGSTDTGYKGSGVYGGSGTNYVGSTAGGYQKPTGGAQVGSGISYTGSTAGDYQGSTGGVHGGSGIGYTVDTTGGYQGQTGDIHGGSGTVYTGSTASGYQETDVHGGSGSVYTVAPTGGYQGSTGGVHGGSGISYTGSTASGYQETDVHGGSGAIYTVAPTGGYQVSTGGAHGGSGTVYVGSTAGGLAGGSQGSVQGGYGGSTGTTYSGFAGQGGVKGGASYGSTSSGSSAGVDYSAGQTGTKYSGYDVTGHGGSTQTFGISGSGVQYTGTTGNDVQVPVSTYVQKPDGPRYNCITCSTTQAPSGQTYVTDGYLISHGVSGSGSTVYQGSNGYSSNTTLVGGHVPSGGPVYHITPGDYGFGEGASGSTILTGHDIQGSIVTGGSSPGTLVTYGQTPGSVLSGSSQQGTIVTGGSYPGYSQTGTGTTGYVVSGGVKTVYPGSVSQGTIVYGTQSPGVVVTGAPDAGTFVKGQTGPGIVVSGQTTPGLSIGSTVQPVTVTGHHGFGETGYTTQQGGLSTGFTYGTKIGKVPTTTGYKTNEYHDNGGRGTIRFNNGDVTTKYTENDIPDYRPAGGTIVPDTLIDGGVSGASTPRGFSKTGSTKTGYTATTLGGSGSYVVGSIKSRPTPRPENIGEKAFEGNVAGYTKSSTTESSVKVYTSSDKYPSTGRIDTSKITLGPSKSSGYSYPVPDVPFVTGVTSPVGSLSPTEGNVFTATTPTPYLNVEVYNTPKYVSSTPVVGNNYQKSTGFGHVTSTVSPFFTTGPLENYKTTAFEAAKIPVVTSTLRPVIDTGYKTIISSTPVPVTISRDQFNVNVQTGSGYDKTQFAYGTKSTQQGGYDRKDYVSGTASSSVFGVPSSRRPQTQYVPSSTISPAIGVTYRKPFTISTVAPAVSSGSYSTGSPTNLNVPVDETGKLITGYRGTTKYVPSQYDVYSSGSFGESSSSTFEQGYSSTPSPVQKTQFAVDTYSGGYSKPSLTYQSTAKSTAVGGGKVIVKWSDLHPLLLGKLGAECTCRGDPFANLRGPGSKLINSSKGKVDLSNYDESDIYVDLEKDDSSEKSDFVTSQESLSTGPIKIWNEEVAAKLSSETQIQQKPSSTYLPGVTSSVNLGVRSNLASSSQNLIGGSFTHGFTANYRSGKSLNFESSSNPAADKQKLLEQFTSFGDSEEVIDGAANCARPGLFRHPNFCNKFYACHWDEWKKKFTLHMFNCPVHLTFDNGANACNWPSMGPACQDDNLLV